MAKRVPVDNHPSIERRPTTAEARLWQAGILQAITDATKPLRDGLSNTDRLNIFKARNWLSEPNPRFIEACTIAGFDPVTVRAKAKRLVEEAEVGCHFHRGRKVEKAPVKPPPHERRVTGPSS